MTRKFVPATVYRPGTPRENEFGEEICTYVADPQSIEIAISVITAKYTVVNDVGAVRATHAALTPCRSLDTSAQIECDGQRYSVEFANNKTPRWATVYLKEVRSDASQG